MKLLLQLRRICKNSKDDLISAFRTLDEEYDKDGYYDVIYYKDYDKYYSQRSYKITINKGKIIDINT